MLIGLFLLLSVPTRFLDFIPLFGDAVGGLARILLFLALIPVVLVLTVLTIFVSIVAHNPFVLVGLIVLVLIGAALFLKKGMKKKKKAPLSDDERAF